MFPGIFTLYYVFHNCGFESIQKEGFIDPSMANQVNLEESMRQDQARERFALREEHLTDALMEFKKHAESKKEYGWDRDVIAFLDVYKELIKDNVYIDFSDTPEIVHALKIASGRQYRKKHPEPITAGFPKRLMGGRKSRIDEIVKDLKYAWEHLLDKGWISTWLHRIRDIEENHARSTVYKALKKAVIGPI